MSSTTVSPRKRTGIGGIFHADLYKLSSITRPRRRMKRSKTKGIRLSVPLVFGLLVLSVMSFMSYYRLCLKTVDSFESILINKASLSYPRGNVTNITFQAYFSNLPKCTMLIMSDIDFTLVSQLSEDRLWMMQHVCYRWGTAHPISIVIFTNRSRGEILRDVRGMGCSSFEDSEDEDEGTSLLQVFDSSQYPVHEYPINALRNMALSAIRTTHAIYIDIDLWPSTGLYQSLHHPKVLEALSLDPKLSVVIPAVQLKSQCSTKVNCTNQNLKKIPFTSAEIPELVLSKDVFQLDPTNSLGHSSTNYNNWLRIVDAVRKGDVNKYSALTRIPCFKSSRYEPYMAFRVCETLPPFQEQFTGYGKNKIAWIMQLRRNGYRFEQLGAGGDYLIHMPHAESASRLEWNRGPPTRKRTHEGKKEDEVVLWSNYKRGRVDSLFVVFEQWLHANVPDRSRIGLCENAPNHDQMLWTDNVFR